MPGRSRESRDWSEGGGSIVLYDDPVVIDFDGAGAVVGDHLAKDLIYHAFILEAGEVVYFFEVKGVDRVAGFIDTPDLDIHGQMAPL
jgi:hypothetical protein